MDCSPPGSSVHRIFQAKILECVAISFSRGSSRPRDWTCISCTGRQVLYHWATGEALPQLILTWNLPDMKQKSCTKCYCQVPINHMWVFSCALFTEHQNHVSMGQRKPWALQYCLWNRHIKEKMRLTFFFHRWHLDTSSCRYLSISFWCPKSVEGHRHLDWKIEVRQEH